MSKHWTNEQDKTLIAAVDVRRNRPTVKELAERFGRTEGAIYHRFKTLGVSLRELRAK